MEILSNKIVKSRKEHRCMWCGGKINKDERYENTSIVNDGEIYV